MSKFALKGKRWFQVYFEDKISMNIFATDDDSAREHALTKHKGIIIKVNPVNVIPKKKKDKGYDY